MQSVVVFERDVIVRELLTATLEASGFLVFSAGELGEATELVTGVAPSMLVLDVGGSEDAKLAGLAALCEACGDAAPVLLLCPEDRSAAGDAFLAERVGVNLIREQFQHGEFVTAWQSLVPAPTPNTAAPPSPGPATTPTPAAGSAPRKPASAKPAAKPASPRPAPAANIDEIGLLKTLAPVVERAQLDEARDRGLHLPLDPRVAASVAKLLASDAATPADLARAVSRDAALTLRALAAGASASADAQRKPVDSLAVAIDRIGKAGLVAILKSAQEAQPIDQADEAFRRDLQACGLDRRADWRHAHAVALIAGEIARLTGGTADAVQSARTAGWLHALGRQVLAHTLPEAYAQAVEAADALGLQLPAVENQMMLDHHGQLMDKLLRGLGVAPSVATAIGCHQLPLVEARNLSGTFFQETITLAIADRYAGALGTGDALADPLQGLEHHLVALKLDATKLAASLEACAKQLASDLDAAAKVFGEALPTDAPWLASLDADVRQRLCPLFVGNDPKNDAFAVLAGTLGGGRESQLNVAIVRLTNVRDRDPLTGKLRGVEFERGLGKLPLLVVSPKGNLGLEDSAMAGRNVQMLAEPVSARRLAVALNTLLDESQGELAQAA